jgi:hypothetical protein
MIQRRILMCSVIAVVAMAGCDGSSSPDAVGPGVQAPGAGSAGSTEPAWRLTSAPADAVDVGQAKQTVSEGDQVALRGRIGGRTDPMSADSATFIVMDVSIPSCADEEGDNCPTPWDYCCEPRESIAANNATVQLVDDSGAPLAIDLRKHGLKPLDEVIAVGTVAARPNEQTLIVKATGLYRAGG